MWKSRRSSGSTAICAVISNRAGSKTITVKREWDCFNELMDYFTDLYEETV